MVVNECAAKCSRFMNVSNRQMIIFTLALTQAKGRKKKAKIDLSAVVIERKNKLKSTYNRFVSFLCGTVPPQSISSKHASICLLERNTSYNRKEKMNLQERPVSSQKL